MIFSPLQILLIYVAFQQYKLQFSEKSDADDYMDVVNQRY